MKFLIMFTILAALVGCDPSQILPPTQSAELQVKPASGGGGTIEPATIPIQVSVSVREKRIEEPATNDTSNNDRCQNCGCQVAKVDEPRKTATDVKQATGSQVNRLQSGYIQWTDSTGVQWNYPPGTALIEGQVSACGQWKYQGGQMVDLRGGGNVQSSGSQWRCTDQGCFRVSR